MLIMCPLWKKTTNPVIVYGGCKLQVTGCKLRSRNLQNALGTLYGYFFENKCKVIVVCSKKFVLCVSCTNWVWATKLLFFSCFWYWLICMSCFPVYCYRFCSFKPRQCDLPFFELGKLNIPGCLLCRHYWLKLSRMWRILQSEVDNTLWDLQNSTYPTNAEFNNYFIVHSK